MNPKEDLTPKTRRETLMCRKAAEHGANAAFQHFNVSVWEPWPGTLGIAKKLYPLKKTVMREVIASGLRYRLNDGKLEYYDGIIGWQPSTRVAANGFKCISDLYANPTEEVDDDGTN